MAVFVTDCYQTLQDNAVQLTPLLPYLSDRRPDIVQRITSCIAACERCALITTLPFC